MTDGAGLDSDLTRYQTHPVVVADDVLLGRIETLNRTIPVSREHRHAFRELGSELTYARKVSMADCTQNDLPTFFADSFICLVRLHPDIESGIGVFREVPLVYSPKSDLQGRYVTALPQLLRVLPPQRAQIERHLFFISTSSQVSDEQVRQLSSPHSRLVRLPDSPPESSSGQSLIRILASAVYTTDLYAREGYVVGEDFFGRSDIIHRIQSNVRLKKASGLMGLRKTGKTSVIKQVIDEAAEDTVYIYQDLEGIDSIRFGDPIPGLIRSIVGYSIQAIKASGGWVQALAEYAEAMRVAGHEPKLDDFSEALRITISNRRNENKMFVLVLDEIEHLVPYDLEKLPVGPAQDMTARFFSILRSIWQSNDNFTFLLSGVTGSPFERAELYGRSNPLFRIADVVWISALSSTDSDDLLDSIGSRQGMIWDTEAKALGFGATGGHPLLLRQLGSAIFGQLSKSRLRSIAIDGPCVRTAIAGYRKSSANDVDEILKFVERFYPDGFAVLRELHKGLSSTDAETLDPGSMGRLQNLGLIKIVDSGWEPSPLLSISRDFRRASIDSLTAVTADALGQLLSSGEGYSIEFKASYSVDLDHDGKVPSEVLKWECLKAVIAFLNSEGGVLLVGVRDSGMVIGLERDLERSGSLDALIRDVQSLINASLGGAVASACKLEVVEHRDSGNQVLAIKVPRWSSPQFLARDYGKGRKSALYVRNNARTDALDGADLVAFLGRR